MTIDPPHLAGAEDEDRALTPEEEDALQEPTPGPAWQWDIPGRLRKVGLLFVAPRQLIAELMVAPDIITPLLLLTVLAAIFLAAFSGQLQQLIQGDVVASLAQVPESDLSAAERAGMPEQLTTLIIWSAGAIGLNHLVTTGMYALVFLWLARYLGYEPTGYAQLLSIANFAWLPRPLFVLALDSVLLSSNQYDSWLTLKQRAAELTPGLHLLLPVELDFEQFGALAAFYLLGPMDLWLVWGLAILWMASPQVLGRPKGSGKLILATAALLIIFAAFLTRRDISPVQLQEMQKADRENPITSVPTPPLQSESASGERGQGG